MSWMLPPCLVVGLLVGCANLPAETPSPPRDTEGRQLADGSSIRLGIGERIALADGSRLTYLRLVNDSRCPANVQCVWAGDAEIALHWQPIAGRAQVLSLHTTSTRGARSVRLGERLLTLDALDRGIAPAATLRVDRAE